MLSCFQHRHYTQGQSSGSARFPVILILILSDQSTVWKILVHARTHTHTHTHIHIKAHKNGVDTNLAEGDNAIITQRMKLASLCSHSPQPITWTRKGWEKISLLSFSQLGCPSLKHNHVHYALKKL